MWGWVRVKGQSGGAGLVIFVEWFMWDGKDFTPLKRLSLYRRVAKFEFSQMLNLIFTILHLCYPDSSLLVEYQCRRGYDAGTDTGYVPDPLRRWTDTAWSVENLGTAKGRRRHTRSDRTKRENKSVDVLVHLVEDEDRIDAVSIDLRWLHRYRYREERERYSGFVFVFVFVDIVFVGVVLVIVFAATPLSLCVCVG